ncbi:MAG: hypothetical protein JWN99_615 [Ilumatobacteraceae bacterium]|nr:hypothetical protein [Ilumatobacteraceae bacterium]
MRLSDLFECTVEDEDGAQLGRISDVRIVQDGPIVGGLQAAFRVDALVVGRAGLAERLGYIKGRISGPWMLRVIFTKLESRALVVPADEVTSWDISTGVLQVRRLAGERAPRLSAD